MPFIKPDTLLQLQIAASSGDIEQYNDDSFDIDGLREGLGMCIVCGSRSCDMTPVHVDGVYVHREAAASADAIGVDSE